jgi:hypothetical protein
VKAGAPDCDRRPERMGFEPQPMGAAAGNGPEVDYRARSRLGEPAVTATLGRLCESGWSAIGVERVSCSSALAGRRPL